MTAIVHVRPLGQRIRKTSSNLAIYAFLAIAAIGFLLPLVYMLSTSLKKPGTEFIWPPTIIPSTLWWDNYASVFTLAPFVRYFANSIFISTVSTVGAVISAALAAFAFARLNFPGRHLL